MSNRNPNYYVAVILAASPLGWFGVHQFYLGNRTKGIIYLVFSLTLIPAMLAVAESFLLLYRGEEWFLDKYGTEEDLETYHLRQLQQQNPLLAQEIQARRQQMEDENIDPEDVAEQVQSAMNEESDDNEEPNTEQTNEDGDNDSDQGSTEPDYSEYYGKW